jgi:hypothetical protein
MTANYLRFLAILVSGVYAPVVLMPRQIRWVGRLIQENNPLQGELEVPADGKHCRDSPVLHHCFNTKGKKGGLGRMPTALNIFVSS